MSKSPTPSRRGFFIGVLGAGVAAALPLPALPAIPVRKAALGGWPGIDPASVQTELASSGGFVVPEDLSNAIIELREGYSAFRQEVPIGRITATGPPPLRSGEG